MTGDPDAHAEEVQKVARLTTLAAIMGPDSVTREVAAIDDDMEVRALLVAALHIMAGNVIQLQAGRPS